MTIHDNRYQYPFIPTFILHTPLPRLNNSRVDCVATQITITMNLPRNAQTVLIIDLLFLAALDIYDPFIQ